MGPAKGGGGNRRQPADAARTSRAEPTLGCSPASPPGGPAERRLGSTGGSSGQYISRCSPSVPSTLLEISSIEVWVVLSVGIRSIWNITSAAATSRLQVSRLA